MKILCRKIEGLKGILYLEIEEAKKSLRKSFLGGFFQMRTGEKVK